MKTQHEIEMAIRAMEGFIEWDDLRYSPEPLADKNINMLKQIFRPGCTEDEDDALQLFMYCVECLEWVLGMTTPGTVEIDKQIEKYGNNRLDGSTDSRE